jgi:putative transposase
MGRPPRPIEDGFVYHAVTRGNNRQDVFHDDEDRLAFLDAVGKTGERYPFRLYGYCLMTDHVHLLMRPEDGVPISRIMQSLLVAHTRRYHKKRGGAGHVWQGRFKSPVIGGDEHLWSVLRYIEANPLRARIVADLADFRWSSYQSHGLGRPDERLADLPGWDDPGATPAVRRSRWRRKVLAAMPEEELSAIRDSLRSGLPLAEPSWLTAHAARLGLPAERRPPGRPRRVEPAKPLIDESNRHVPKKKGPAKRLARDSGE